MSTGILPGGGDSWRVPFFYPRIWPLENRSVRSPRFGIKIRAGRSGSEVAEESTVGSVKKACGTPKILGAVKGCRSEWKRQNVVSFMLTPSRSGVSAITTDPRSPEPRNQVSSTDSPRSVRNRRLLGPRAVILSPSSSPVGVIDGYAVAIPLSRFAHINSQASLRQEVFRKNFITFLFAGVCEKDSRNVRPTDCPDQSPSKISADGARSRSDRFGGLSGSGG